MLIEIVFEKDIHVYNCGVVEYMSNFIAQNLFLKRFSNVWNDELGISSTGIAQN
jgi:hypothetical protein